MNLQPLLDALSEGKDVSLDGLSRPDWEQLARAVRLGAFPKSALVNLVRQASGNNEAVPVIAELTSDLGVALAVSRAMLTEDSVNQLQTLLEDSGFTQIWDQSGPPERLVVPLARLLGDSRSWVWLARALFHSSVVGKVPELIGDSDADVRLAATLALAQTDGDEATDALFTLLSDTDDRIRQAARDALEPRCTEPALKARLEKESAELDQLVARADSSLLERLPTVSGLLAALRKQQKGRRLPLDPRRKNVLESLRRRFRLYRGREDATAYVVMGVAMAWADGEIRPAEQQALESLVDEHLALEERASVQALIREKPTAAQLGLYLNRLEDPKQVADALREDFDLGGETAENWLKAVAIASGFDEGILLP